MAPDRPRPFFSVIVATYERPGPLASCLKSLAHQTLDRTEFEVLVVDDGSACHNRQNVDAFKGLMPVTYIFQDHRGVAAARNTGIKNARGAFLIFIDDDFSLAPEYLSRVKEFFVAHPQAQVLTAHIISCGRGLGRIVQQLYLELTFWRDIKEDRAPLINHPTILAANGPVFKKNVFDSVGMYDEALQGGEDAEISYRLSQKGVPIFHLPSLPIYHWENKSFWEFLKQRYCYGANTFDARKRTGEISTQLTSALPHPLKIYGNLLPRSVLRTYGDFFRTASRMRKMPHFLFFTPLLILFILSFWLGLYRKALLSQARIPTLPGSPRAPVKKPGKITAQIKYSLLHMQRIPLLKRFFGHLQKIPLGLFIRSLKRHPEIRSLYVTGSMAGGNYFFGTSDIDMLVFLHPLSPENEFETVRRIYRDTARLTSFMKILKLERIFSQQDIKFMEKLGSDFFLIDPGTCRLVAGDPMDLSFLAHPLPKTALLGLFFRALGAHRLLTRDYLRSRFLGKDCLRDFYKNTYKICHILTDMELVAEGHDIFGGHENRVTQRVTDPLLKEICRKSGSTRIHDFFSKQGEEEIAHACVHLLQWINSEAAKFFPVPGSKTVEAPQKNSTSTVPQGFLEYALHLNRIAAGTLTSILYFDSQLFLVAKNGASSEDLKKLLRSAKESFRDGSPDGPDPETVTFWMPQAFRAFGSHDPFWHEAYLESAHSLAGEAPYRLISAPASVKDSIRKLYVLNALSEMKKGFRLAGDELLKHQKRILNHIAVNRILFEKDIVPPADKSKEVYQQCFAGEPQTPQIIRLLEYDISRTTACLKTAGELHRDYYLSQRYLIDRLEPFMTGRSSEA